MRRPVSILCLADIHYDDKGNMDALKNLKQELSEFIGYDKNNKKWDPDYIVIAGDLANKGSGYIGVDGFIDGLRGAVAPERVVLVPGNHDVCKTSGSIEDMKKLKDCFNDFCKDPKNNKTDFETTFKNKFNAFVSFSEKYNKQDKKNILYPQSSIISEQIKCLSGVKVFDEDQLCFVHVNTEWLYESGKHDSRVMHSVGGKVEDITPFMRKDEDCHLCAPLVKEVYGHIKKCYPTYTVVTVMHRWIDHLSWEENNVSDSSKIDSIGYILNGSDIIITGHDHVYHPMPPTLVGNRVQHIQLGSVGRKESLVSELSRFAEIIRIDVHEGIIEQLFIQFQGPFDKDNWKFIESEKIYPLYDKFSCRENTKLEKPDSGTILRAKSSNEQDIQEAVDFYFQKKGIVLLHADETVCEKIERELSKAKGFVHIVVFYLYPEYNSELSSKIKGNLDGFRDKHIADILRHKIILNELIVEYPEWEWIGEFSTPQKKLSYKK